MNLSDLTSSAGAPQLKPALAIVAGSVETVNLAVKGRITQEDTKVGPHLTPYSLWAYTDLDSDTAGAGIGVAVPIGGTLVGSGDIPSTSCYDGMSIRVKVGGLITTAGADSLTFSVRDSTGTIIHASASYAVDAETKAQTVVVDFDIQVAKAGGAGVGIERSISRVQIINTMGAANRTSDAVTFSTDAGVEYYLFFDAGVATSVFTRELAYATVVY